MTTLTPRAPFDPVALAMGFAFAFIWSSAFTSARVIVQEVSPLAALSVRFVASGVLAVGIARVLGQSWRLSTAQWRAVIVFGLCQNVVYLGLNFVAMQTVEASLAAIIASTMPLLVAFISWLGLGTRLPATGILGLVLGFAGAVLILSARLGGGTDPLGLALCLISVVALTFATLAVRSASGGSGNLLMVVGLQMFVGALVLAPIALAFEPFRMNLTPAVVGAFVYTTIFPGVIATWIWFALVERIGATPAATYHFLNPFFGVVVAAVLLGEAVGPRDIIGVAVVGVGIYLVQRARDGRGAAVNATQRASR